MRVDIDQGEVDHLADLPEVRAGVHDSASNVAKDAARRAPVLSGDLRKSITAVPDGKNAYRVVMLWYGLFAEVGTQHERARPFLRPAADRYR